MPSFASFFVLAAVVCTPLDDGGVDFNRDIRPILSKHCLACHGGVKQASGLSFTNKESALGIPKSGTRAIVPAHPDESELIARVGSEAPAERMPPPEHGPALDPREIELLRSWIAEGAHWKEHWAFVAPEAQKVPEVRDLAWCRGPIDRFVLARIEAAGLAPSVAADRDLWLRRASFDLIGLPPTREEIEQFAGDDRPTARARAVDRLLATPRFGERWASVWIDLARYADTQGYEKDPHRDAWPFRDWVVRALNADMSFRDFTIKQLAGDLLQNPTLDDRVATLFHRNTQTNTEGGTDDEEFRLAAVIDRANTTWQTWMGVTFGCVQCHGHPYDAIQHNDFYNFLAIFNTTSDSDLDDDAPRLAVPLDRGRLEEAEGIDRRLLELRERRFGRWVALANRSDLWERLVPERVDATGQTRLSTRDRDGVREVIAEGTLTARSKFTIESRLPANLGQLTALRIDVLPADTAAALRIPEMGFGISHLRAWIVEPESGSDPREIAFQAAACDEPSPHFDPEASLHEDAVGWADFTRQTHPRWAVFVPESPVSVPPDGHIRIELQQNLTATGDIALLARRSRYSVSNDAAWTDLAHSPSERQDREERASLGKARAAIASVSVPTMLEQPLHLRRRSFTFVRGNWLEKGSPARAGVPAVFPPMPPNEAQDRLAAARWIVSDENPLTGRVLANRLWEQCFGTGIVETLEDFGSAGAPPSHPELLDHLGVRLRGDQAWSIKAALRDIIQSSTYGQSMTRDDRPDSIDPRNRLLSRAPRRRLSAEMVRDQALAVSGLLSGKMFGPPVMPPQPEGVWRSVYNGSTWKTATAPDRHRRAVYTYCKRTSGYPSGMAFDAPTREVCTARRITTNTPLQALVTMNDEVFIECARALADRMAKEGADPNTQIAAGFREVVGREPSASVVERLRHVYDDAIDHYLANSDEAKRLAPTSELFARTVVANVLLNLDASLAR
jgi:hypothetical protein